MGTASWSLQCPSGHERAQQSGSVGARLSWTPGVLVATRPLQSPMGQPWPQHAVTASDLIRALPLGLRESIELKIDLMLAVALGSEFPPPCNGSWSTVALTPTAIASIAVIVEIKTMMIETVHLAGLYEVEKRGFDGL